MIGVVILAIPVRDPLAVLAPLRSGSGPHDGRVIANCGSIALQET